MFRLYADLTKFGIVVFVLLTGLAGYGLSFPIEKTFDPMHLLVLIGGLFFLSSGSLALNQVQEYKIDQKMARTAHRPIAAGKLKPAAGIILSVSFLLIGGDLLLMASETSAILGWLTVLLYNGFYTLWWKKKMVFGAVPGALPGALPVTIGYAANQTQIFSPESVYMFLILFLWQMPHFWALAIRYREDYAKANIPTMPVVLGVPKTIFHIGLYTFVYVAVALLAPLFTHSGWVYLIAVIPVCFKILQEYFRFYRSAGTQKWFAFFMWVNTSLLVFLFVPVINKWSFLLSIR